jgi:hypothetical protein
MTPETVAAVITAAGTLVLALATFNATRSATRATRIAERSLLASLRPLLVHAQLGDPRQKIAFADDHWVHVDGPQAIFDVTDDAIYLAFGLRNVGSGIGIIQAWYPNPGRESGADHRPIAEFRPQIRALYVPPGGLGFWQGALRDRDEQVYASFETAASEHQPVTIDLLYSDQNGGQRTITRLLILPSPTDHETAPGGADQPVRWIASMRNHWPVDDHAAN